MNDWEHHANISLQSLADALERGQLDRSEYRLRRRRILEAGRNRHAQTQPNALLPRAGTARSGGERTRRNTWLPITLTVLAMLLALLGWWIWRSGQ